MILQALKDYYDRKAADPDSGIAPLGWEWKEIPWLIVIGPDGAVVNVEDTREKIGKKMRAHAFKVPKAVIRSSDVVANLFWDNVEYVSGYPCKGNSESARERFDAFRARLEEFKGIAPADAVINCLARPTLHKELASFPEWKDACKKCADVTFKLAGSPSIIVNESGLESEIDAILARTDNPDGVCLITGEPAKIMTKHPVIKNVRNAQSSGARIVSFNKPPFCSFRKIQGANAPIGEVAAFKYTTALNTLLGKNSEQKVLVGDATTVFWAEKDGVPLESSFLGLINEPPRDDPDRLVNNVKQLFNSVYNGAFTHDEGLVRFYVLGLSPSDARLSVRFWECATVGELSTRIKQYFDDLRIGHGPKDQEHLSLWRLLVSTAALGKTENILPNLAGNVMRAILEGLPFPESLLQATIQRVKATHDVSYPRAKLLRGCLNRKLRRFNFNNEREIAMSLDKENTNVGYCLGRLFATLEKIQQKANPGINATIRDRFYASASSMPVRVFGNLMRLNIHHLSKVKNAGLQTYFKQLLGEIIAKVNGEFPAQLSLDDQGRFAIGYYHQQRDFFAKSNKPSQSAN